MSYTTVKKIDAMHMLFGTCADRKCADCDHLCSRIYDRRYYKCELYGDSASEATDWAKSWTACGLIDDPNGAEQFCAEWETVMRYLKHNRQRQPEPQLEGQMCMEDFL